MRARCGEGVSFLLNQRVRHGIAFKAEVCAFLLFKCNSRAEGLGTLAQGIVYKVDIDLCIKIKSTYIGGSGNKVAWSKLGCW